MEAQTARRRVEIITAHLSPADNISATAVGPHVFPLNCSGGLTSIKRRGDNRIDFARQDSRSQGGFMRQASTEQDFSGQSSLPSMSTLSHKDGSSELVTPLFSQPASINSNVPKVRNLQYAVDDYMLPSPQPPKFARTTVERDVPRKFSPKNSMHTTKHLGNQICQMACGLSHISYVTSFIQNFHIDASYDTGLEEKQSPRMDVAESKGKYILLIELPGISKDDIRVEVHNTTLIVQTAKGRTTSCSFSDRASSSYYRREILEGPFEIVWPLPLDVNPDSVSAEFLDGLLRVTIPKLRVPVW
ncbi:Alpha crystallin/Hsp20 domain-containing protein [Cynara cardunculus var. scolymus]|uniref:Alpha crystallin/Hsp20 domain-containing protein n=1 Tax=Cynara cardunculus var. scolymus TaxID=59895 RepID=A0A124SDP2_CYNCS|nr:Alpha crystallin/Hsp20 domain-containing protein [Cynara cardunculus var. scolymus]